jgi:hypothetical protein
VAQPHLDRNEAFTSECEPAPSRVASSNVERSVEVGHGGFEARKAAS